eukprot:scaffold8025_cov20-Tisochrysis_lutea.AAC.2
MTPQPYALCHHSLMPHAATDTMCLMPPQPHAFRQRAGWVSLPVIQVSRAEYYRMPPPNAFVRTPALLQVSRSVAAEAQSKLEVLEKYSRRIAEELHPQAS